LLPGDAGAKQVHVVVDEPGNNCPPARVDAARVRTRMPGDFLVAANGNDPIAADGDGLRDREALVNGDDLAVRDDEIGRQPLRQGKRAEGHGEDERSHGF
jgi:hypothetical protein